MPFLYYQTTGHMRYTPLKPGERDQDAINHFLHSPVTQLDEVGDLLHTQKMQDTYDALSMKRLSDPDGTAQALYSTLAASQTFIDTVWGEEGILLPKGNGYSGISDNTHKHNPHLIRGQNNPDAQNIQNIGPIPRGAYTIGPPHKSPLGNPTFNLTPYPGTVTFGRSAFRIHADSTKHPGSASEGCVILDGNTRRDLSEKMAQNNDHLLIVLK